MVTYLTLILWLISPFYRHDGRVSPAGFPFAVPSRAEPRRMDVCSNPYYLAFAPYTAPAKSACRHIAGSWQHAFASRTPRWPGDPADSRGGLVSRSEAIPVPPGRFASPRSRPGWLPRLPAPSLDGNPVLWREWHRSQPSGSCAWFGSCTWDWDSWIVLYC